MTGCISGTTVYLTGVLTGESATTVSTFTTVGIYDNLASRQTGISVRSADNELSGRINMIGDMVIEQCKYFLCMNRSNDTWHQDIDDILTDSGKHFFIRFQLGSFAVVGRLDEIIMLGRNYNCIDADRRTVIIVFNSYLTLGVRTEISHFFTFATDVGQHLQDAMCQVERKRHVVFCFVSSIAEHHALVACPLFHRVLAFHAAVDVGALFMDGREYAATFCLELVFRFGIADTADRTAGYFLQVDVSF